MDVSNKPATKELHLTNGQNSYIHQVAESSGPQMNKRTSIYLYYGSVCVYTVYVLFGKVKHKVRPMVDCVDSHTLPK